MRRQVLVRKGKVRLAQNDNFAPFLTNEDQVLVDDSHAEQHMQGKHGLTVPQLIHVEGIADEIFDLELKAKPTTSLSTIEGRAIQDRKISTFYNQNLPA